MYFQPENPQQRLSSISLLLEHKARDVEGIEHKNVALKVTYDYTETCIQRVSKPLTPNTFGNLPPAPNWVLSIDFSNPSGRPLDGNLRIYVLDFEIQIPIFTTFFDDKGSGSITRTFTHLSVWWSL